MLHRHHQQEPQRDPYQWLLQQHHQTIVVCHGPNTKKKCTSSGTTALTSARSGRKSVSASTASFPAANSAGFRVSNANSTASFMTSVRHCASRDWCMMENFCARAQGSTLETNYNDNHCVVSKIGPPKFGVIKWMGMWYLWMRENPEQVNMMVRRISTWILFFMLPKKLTYLRPCKISFLLCLPFPPYFSAFLSALSPFTILPAGLAAGKPITGGKFLYLIQVHIIHISPPSKSIAVEMFCCYSLSSEEVVGNEKIKLLICNIAYEINIRSIMPRDIESNTTISPHLMHLAYKDWHKHLCVKDERNCAFYDVMI